MRRPIASASVLLRRAVTAVLAFAVLHPAVADAHGDEVDAAPGSDNTSWMSPGLRFAAPAAFGDRLNSGEVRWQRQGGASTWFARVSMGPLRPAELGDERPDGATSAPTPPLLQGEAQWSYRGWERHVVRLGAQARHDLLLPAAQASALGAYVQEEWSVASDWRLALGLRGDGAPAAEGTLTPRAALSWQARPGLELRLVDGVAWRDPNVSIATAPPAAPPTVLASGVRLHATELALDWQALSELRLAASLDQQRDSTAVTGVAPGVLPQALRFQHIAASSPTSPGEGVGVEGEYAVVDGWRVNARWAAFAPRSSDETAGAARLFTALQAHAPLPWHGASAGLQWMRIDQRVGTSAAGAPTQTLLNATLAWTPSGSPWSVAANGYNLADHAAAAGALAPQDALVHEGRRWQVQLARLF